MNLLNVVNWIGVFALAVGSLISVVQGGFIISLFAVLLASVLVTSLVPVSGKLQLILRGIPRIELVQKLGRVIGVTGVWVLAGVGGWEYLPAAVVLTVGLLAQVAMMIKGMRMRRRTGAMIANESETPTLTNASGNKMPLSTPQSPPQYSTIRIVEEKSGGLTENDHNQQPEQQVTIKIDQTQQPVFNV